MLKGGDGSCVAVESVQEGAITDPPDVYRIVRVASYLHKSCAVSIRMISRKYRDFLSGRDTAVMSSMLMQEIAPRWPTSSVYPCSFQGLQIQL